MHRSHLPLACLACLTVALTACSVGPKYQRPEVQVPPGFKEASGWKVAQPNDGVPRGKWWELFQHPQLNDLEEQIDVSNQTLAVAEAQLRGARAAVSVARAALFPTVTAGASVSGARQSQNRPGVSNPS